MWVDIESEKTHQTLLQRVESYDKSTLKPAETIEKVVLPAKEGNFLDLLRPILFLWFFI